MVEVEVQFDYKAENDDELTVQVGDVITNVIQNDGGWWEGEFNGRRGVFPDNFVKVRLKDTKMLAAAKNSATDSTPKSNGGSSGVGGVVLRKEKKRRCKVLFSYKPVNEDELELEVDEIIEVLEEVEEGWWKGRVSAGGTGVFPSNFVQEIDPIEVDVFDGPAASDKHQAPSQITLEAQSEIKPKPIKGIGYGNIFQDGMVKLKATPTAGLESPKVGQNISNAIKKLPPAAGPVANSMPVASLVTTPLLPPNAPQLPPKPVKEQARVVYAYDAQNNDELSLKEGDIINIVSKEVDDKGWWKGELNGRIGVFPDNFVELIVIEDMKIKKPGRPDKGPTLANSNSKMKSESTPNGPSTTDAPTTRQEKVASLPRGLSARRLPPDVPKKDASPTEDKADKPVPPLPFKKPHLPPPLKKAQRQSGVFSETSLPSASEKPSSKALGASSTSGTFYSSPSSTAAASKKTVIAPSATASSIEPTRSDETDGSRLSTSSNRDDDGSISGSGLGFDSIECSSEKLVHLTANRAKNPNRRPPSHLFHKDSDKTNGDVAHLENGENPWMREMKRTQAAKRASQVIHEPHTVRDAVIKETESESFSSRTGSLGRSFTDKDEGRLSTTSAKSSSSVGIIKHGLSPSPTVPKTSQFSDDVDSKDSKSSSSIIAATANATDQPTSSPDVTHIVTSLQEKFDVRFNQLARQYSELSEEYEVHKIVTMRRIEELYGELQIEKKHRLSLQDEVQRLRDVRM